LANYHAYIKGYKAECVEDDNDLDVLDDIKDFRKTNLTQDI
jgi:hypothetical protein